MIDVTTLPPPRLAEVGPRDGLQYEARVVPTEAKVAFVDALSESGVREISAGAFGAKGPQLADSAEVFESMKRKEGVHYLALVLDEKGLDEALQAEADKIEIFCAASESYSRKTTGAAIAQALERLRPVVARARAAKLPVRAGVGTAFHCPYEGAVAPDSVAALVERLRVMGVGEFSLADTVGRASPQDVRVLLEILLKRLSMSSENIFLHFHDTYGMALANALTAWTEYKISGFDASCGGVGGCPYAEGVGGNVATEDLAFAFLASGAPVRVDFQKLRAAGRALAVHLGHPLPSH